MYPNNVVDDVVDMNWSVNDGQSKFGAALICDSVLLFAMVILPSVSVVKIASSYAWDQIGPDCNITKASELAYCAKSFTKNEWMYITLI